MSVKSFGSSVAEFRDLHKSYDIVGREDAVTALNGIDLNSESPFPPVRQNEFVILRGPSGGGKTTLLNIIGTLDKPSEGELKLFGEIIDINSNDSELSLLRLKKIGFVFQSFNLLAAMSAFENVELPMTILGVLSPKERKSRAKMLLERVGLHDRMDHLPSELSGGERQVLFFTFISLSFNSIQFNSIQYFQFYSYNSHYLISPSELL
eukprot:TRINITY_DN6953_c0_g1_i1.p1 TRINITY_DN6953_c0_g1~~TRINITY_DN6953_c0_g1_i1.p1  ORF type:complete len:227 (-),score=37.36 TRINITY_DN6953_c0_g1_i1:409-1032(-)